MSDFLISALAGLDPYVPGEQPQGREYVKLNTNESPFPPSPCVLDALSREEVSRLNLYSDPTALPLRRAIADTYGLSPDNVFCGNGSDEVLGFSFLAFADGAHPVPFPAVSYGFYRVFANLFRVPTNAVPLREDFTVPVEPFLGTGGMVVLANPNAPTGISLPLAEVERIVRANPDHIVLVDEAYVDFGAESCVPMIYRYDNLLVTQTMSKSRSLAGGRVGYGVDRGPEPGEIQLPSLQCKPAVHRGRGRRCGGRGVLRRLHRCHPADPGLDRGRAGEFGLHCPALPGQLRLCPPLPASR